MVAMDLAFGFPEYFSECWGSLEELMRDPFWIHEVNITLRILNNDKFNGKLRMEALAFLQGVKEHLENPKTVQELNYKLTIELK